jgi:hypothetical protein
MLLLLLLDIGVCGASALDNPGTPQWSGFEQQDIVVTVVLLAMCVCRCCVSSTTASFHQRTRQYCRTRWQSLCSAGELTNLLNLLVSVVAWHSCVLYS